MTVAQINTAAEILKHVHPAEIVSFTEVGSEGAVLVLGTWMNRRGRWLIARDGVALKDER